MLLHPKYPIPGLCYRRVCGRREAQRQRHARIGRVEDAVVPQPRGRVERVPLALVGLQNRVGEGLALGISASLNAPIEKTSFGVFRM